uniref:Uncharacterized protein n=1 Tax=Acrobeloides nanus TaxID=290746 RepID=A0A914DB81_9BILA
MELLGVQIGARCASFIQASAPTNRLDHTLDRFECVLAWVLAQGITRLRVFESNRVREIRQLPVNQYRYVPTKYNPADLGTRGTTLAELNDCRLWHKGPEWLNRTKEHWPPLSDNQFDYREWLLSQDNADPEIVASVKEVKEEIPIFETTRYPTFEKLLFVITFVCRFIRLKFGKIAANKQAFNAAETSRAIIVAIKESQRCYPSNDAEIQNLGIRADNQGLLRCYGRMEPSQLAAEAINPIFISKKSTLAELIMD